MERLHRASTEGRIAAHELEQRVAAALKATTYSELDATTSDLPLAARPGNGRRAGQRALSTIREHPAALVVAIPVILVVIAMLLALTMLWLLGTIAVLALGHRRRALPPPWAYTARRRLGSTRRGGWA